MRNRVRASFYADSSRDALPLGRASGPLDVEPFSLYDANKAGDSHAPDAHTGRYDDDDAVPVVN